MNICIISHDFYPSIGGIAAHVFQLSKALADKGNNVLVISIRYSSELPFIEKKEGLKIIRFRSLNINKVRGILFILQAVPTLFILSRLVYRFNVVHWHNIWPDTILGLFSKSKHKFFTNHSSGFLEMFNKNKANYFYRILFKDVKIIAPSNELAEKSEIFFNKKKEDVKFISNAVNINKFTPGERPVYLLNKFKIKEEKVILCPRRMEPKNGVEFFIKSIPFVLNKNPKTKFIIAGNIVFEDYGNKLKDLIEKLNIKSKIIFTGGVPNDIMVDLYRLSDVVVLPSLMEATSIAGLEALSCGVPVVGTNVGGIPQIIKDKRNGFIVSPKDYEDMAEKINIILSNKNLLQEMSRLARLSVENNFSWNKIAVETLMFYKK